MLLLKIEWSRLLCTPQQRLPVLFSRPDVLTISAQTIRIIYGNYQASEINTSLCHSHNDAEQVCIWLPLDRAHPPVTWPCIFAGIHCRTRNNRVALIHSSESERPGLAWLNLVSQMLYRFNDGIDTPYMSLSSFTVYLWPGWTNMTLCNCKPFRCDVNLPLPVSY